MQFLPRRPTAGHRAAGAHAPHRQGRQALAGHIWRGCRRWRPSARAACSTFCWHPTLRRAGVIYLSYGEPRGDGKNGTSVARAKLVFDGDGARLEDVKVIFRQQPAANSGHHFGSRLVWAKDGTLFVTTGERNKLRDQSQNPANDIGKIIRINADGSIPADNPKLARLGAGGLVDRPSQRAGCGAAARHRSALHRRAWRPGRR